MTTGDDHLPTTLLTSRRVPPLPARSPLQSPWGPFSWNACFITNSPLVFFNALSLSFLLSVPNFSFWNEREETSLQSIQLCGLGLLDFVCLFLYYLLLWPFILCYPVLFPCNWWNWSRWGWPGSQSGISHWTSVPKGTLTTTLLLLLEGALPHPMHCLVGWQEGGKRQPLFSSGLGILDPEYSGHSENALSIFHAVRLFGLHMNDCLNFVHTHLRHPCHFSLYRT